MQAAVPFLPMLDRAFFKGTDGYTYLNVKVKIYVNNELDMAYDVPCRFFFVALAQYLSFFRFSCATVDIWFCLLTRLSPWALNKKTSVPTPFSNDKEKMFFNLMGDLADFNLEKRLRDPKGTETWVYSARFGKYRFQFVAGPKAIRMLNTV